MTEQQPRWIWQQPNWPVFTWQDQRLVGLLREV
jgi:ABC-type antimicrobial peptide transport system ATPase subunit